MAVKKLSEIALAGSPPALTDTVVGVGGGTTDLQYTLAQVQTTMGSGSGVALKVGSTPVVSGTSGFALTDNAGVLGNTAIRTILTANQSRFITTIGNDSNDGLTLGTAWATLDHAMAVIANTYDIAGFEILVSVGAGTFAGFGIRPTLGGGLIAFIGASSGSTTISEGINDGTYNAGECLSSYFPATGTHFVFNGFKWTFVSEVNYALIGLFSQYLVINFNDAANNTADHAFNLSTTTTDTVLWASAIAMQIGFFRNVTGGYTINYSPASTAVTAETFHVEAQCEVNHVGGFFTLVGSPVFQDGGPAFLNINSSKWSGNPTYSGAATGPGVFAAFGSVVLDPSGTFPGSTFGFVDNSSVYSTDPGPSFGAFPGTASIAGAPTTSQLPGQGIQGLFKDTGQSTATKGLAFYANDAGAVFPVTLLRTVFADLPASPRQGDMASISDGLAANCADGSCTTFGTHVTGGGGALNLLIWYNSANWTLLGK